MSEPPDVYRQLQDLATDLPLADYLSRLADVLRGNGQYHELFEVRKMELRHRLGLPLLYDDSGSKLDRSTSEALDRGLLEACREVGTLLFGQSKATEGWMYLRAVGDLELAGGLLRQIEVTEDRIDELIQVAVYEGVDLEYGFRLLLEQYGICNAITTFEQVMQDRSPRQRELAARQLVEQLYRDLTENVAHDRAQREGRQPESQRLIDLISGHDELFEENAYHIDTSHLAAVVRFARLLDDAPGWEMGWELSEYGRRLAPLYQLPEISPFESFYPAHSHFFAALLERDPREVEQATVFFQREAERVLEPDAPDPSMAREVYIDLLIRLGQGERAVREAVRLYPERLPGDLVATLLEVASGAGATEWLLEYARDHGDLLTFGTLLALRRDDGNGAAASESKTRP